MAAIALGLAKAPVPWYERDWEEVVVEELDRVRDRIRRAMEMGEAEPPPFPSLVGDSE